MKRKCYALLSLLLAVCMVLPMGIFVGAADTISLTVSGAIDGTSGKRLDDAKGKDLAVYVATEGFIDISVTYPDGYTLSAQSTNNGVTRLQDNGNGSYRVIGTSTYGDAKDTITFTAKKGETTLTAKVNVTVVEPVITGMDVTFTNVSLSTGKTTTLNPGTVVEVEEIDYDLSNNDKEENASGTVEYAVNGGSFDKNPITVKGGDTSVSVKYTEGTLTYINTYLIAVAGKTIETITLAPKSDAELIQYAEDYTVTAAAVNSNIQIAVAYKDGTSAELSNKYTLVFVNKDTNKESESLSISIADRDKYSVYAVYDGVKSNVCALSNIIKINEKVPKSFTMDVRNATKKDYIEGETLNDFSGVTVTVAYTDKSEKTFKGDEIKSLNLYIHPFVYGEKSIIAEYGDLLAKVDVSYLNISRNNVKKIEAVTSGVTLKYDVGDKLDLTGLKIKLTYSDNTTKTVSYTDSRIECSPANGSEIASTDKKVFVAYTDPDSGEQLVTSFALTISTNKKLMSADLAYGSNGKTAYFIGETFQKSGFRVTLYYNDSTKETLALDSDKLSITYKSSDGTKTTTTPSFATAQSGYFTLIIKRDGCNGEAELDLALSVTKRPNLKSITAICTKENDDGQHGSYFVGDVPSVRDFEITVYYDDNSTRTFVVSEDETVSTKAPYSFTRQEDGVTYTVKLSPTTIAEDTKTITVSYNEYVTVGTKSNKTVETEVEIKVTIPDCILKHYTSSRYYETKTYESLFDALEASADGDELQLYRDVTMTSDYASKKSLEIDLNGHTLTMVKGEVYVYSGASSSTEITFSNTSRDDAHIRYTNNEDEDVIVSYGKEYVINRSSNSNGKYDITITSVKNGKVTGPSEVIHGHDAKFTITPNDGYEIAAIKVNSKTYKASSDNTLLIEDVREKLTVTVTFQEKAWQNPFTDVSKSATYYKAVQFVYEEGLFNGTSATKFEPDTTMTRAMFVTVLGRLAGVEVDNYKTSSFSDVATGQWYSEYVEWASSIGLVEGYGNGKFGPNDSITHAQMYVLMERYADIIEGKTTVASGTSISANDVRDIPDWAYEAVEYAAKKDFLVVSSYKLTPNDNAKRSELAMLLQKFCKNVLEY